MFLLLQYVGKLIERYAVAASAAYYGAFLIGIISIQHIPFGRFQTCTGVFLVQIFADHIQMDFKVFFYFTKIFCNIQVVVFFINGVVFGKGHKSDIVDPMRDKLVAFQYLSVFV